MQPADLLKTDLSSTRCYLLNAAREKRASRSSVEIARIRDRSSKNLPGIPGGMDLIITERGIIRCGNCPGPEK